MAAVGAGRFDWSWQGQSLSTHYEQRGARAPLLLLPAFSTVSTRAEMAPLAQRLASDFQCTLLDWPGFGDGAQPALRHEPTLQLAFLQAFTQQVCARGSIVIAAGHAAAYALALGRSSPGLWSSMILVAPTWRGPLPTMMKGYRPVQRWLKRAIELPVLGHALYRLNVTRAVIAFMYRRHVYDDVAHLGASFIDTKARVARQPGRRFGAAAFVTGGLDLVHERAAFAALASPPVARTLVLYGAHTPPKSKAEMMALAALPGIESQLLPRGTLGLYEEYPDDVAVAVRAFLHL